MAQKNNNPLGKMNGKKDNSRNNKNKVSNTLSYIYILIAVAIGIYFLRATNTTMQEIDNTQFKQMVENRDVDRMEYVNKSHRANVYLTKEALKQSRYESVSKNVDGPQYYISVSDYSSFQEELKDIKANAIKKALAADTTLTETDIIDNYDFPVKQDNSRNWGWDLMIWFLPMLLIVGMMVMWMRSMRGGSGPGGGNIFSIGKSRAQEFDEKSGQLVTFKDVAGLEGAKFEIEEVVDFLKNPKKYTVLGGKIPKGVLLVGPPGTGKTLLAKAVAGEAKVPFFSLSGSDFVEMFVGVGASRVRDLFKTAKEKAPCIIFIDEIDAIGRARGKNAMSNVNDERESTLNQLLTEMDGFSTNAGVIIMAATNRADILDRALLRAGRFDRQIQVELPNLSERRGIFGVHVRNIKIGPDVDLDFFAKQTPGFSGADIANICNEAALIAARNNKEYVEKEDFLAAIDRIIGGLERRSSVFTPEEKRAVAYHEAGHATVSWLLQYASPLVKVTIVPRGKALGAAWYLPEERQLTNYDQLVDEMTALLGGRAAEDAVFGQVSTGALNDLERTSKMAYAMVAYYGLDKKIGNVSYYDSTGQQEFAFGKPYSEKTAQDIDQQVHDLVESCYQRAKSILEQHMAELEQLAQLLLEREVIFAEDVERILGKRPFAKKEDDAPTTAATEQPSEPAQETAPEPAPEQNPDLQNDLSEQHSTSE